MPRKRRATLAEPPADPFQERHRFCLRERLRLMGGRFHFETDSPRLIDLVRCAYAELPSHEFPGGAPRFSVRLTLTSKSAGRAPATGRAEREPPRVRPLAGDGILCGVMDGANFVSVSAQQRSALIAVSSDMLAFPYHIRYEMVEFAVYVLASRVQGLVPLHAACIGDAGVGILLLGASGAGKTTLSLHCLLEGLDFLAEDSVLVRPDGLLATGVPNFLHVRPDSLRFLDTAGHAAVTRNTSSVIRRRSGVEKLEIDLRNPRFHLAAKPLRIGAVVFVSSRKSGTSGLLIPLRGAELTGRLAAGQRYAAQQPGWNQFSRRLSRVPAFELRRGNHPLQAVEALKTLLPRPISTAGRR